MSTFKPGDRVRFHHDGEPTHEKGAVVEPDGTKIGQYLVDWTLSDGRVARMSYLGEDLMLDPDFPVEDTPSEDTVDAAHVVVVFVDGEEYSMFEPVEGDLDLSLNEDGVLTISVDDEVCGMFINVSGWYFAEAEEEDS